VSSVTEIQKGVLIGLAKEFYPKAFEIFIRGSSEDVSVYSDVECAVVKSFMDMIVQSVGDKYPDDDDLNHDAILAVFLGSRILNDYVRTGRS